MIGDSYNREESAEKRFIGTKGNKRWCTDPTQSDHLIGEEW